MIRATALSAAIALLCCAAALASEASPKTVSLEFRGKLRDGLREIASKGGINLIATGELEEPVEIHLSGVSAEEALSTVATAYRLKVHRQGSIWTLRPMTAEEILRADSEQREPPKEPAAEGDRAPQPAAPPEATEKVEADEEESPLPPSREELGRKVSELKAKLRRHGKGEKAGTGSVVVEDGQVVDSAVAFGGSLTIGSGAVVEDDAVAFGGDVILKSGSVVEGDAVAFGGQVHKEEGAVVEGDEVSMGGGSLGASVARKIRSVGPGHEDEPEVEHRGRGSGFPGFFVRFALLFGLGFLFTMFAPARMKQIEGELAREPLKCGLTGLVGGVVLLMLTVLLAVTIIGIPFAVALVVVVGVLIAMGFSAVAAEVGVRLPVFRRSRTQALVLALGLLVLLLASEVPLLGPLATAAVILVGLGAIIRTRLGQPGRGVPQPEAPQAG
ncbi:MAG: hypothetical protein HYZ28_04480 [Myxococcales bacterium]|nr:hypothetical protein [Myxococcales bacterium]